MEIDDDSDHDDDDADVLTCIKDVVFTCEKHGSFKLTHVRIVFFLYPLQEGSRVL